MQLSKIAMGAVLVSITCAQQVKFMPLGDSITESACWRAKVWDQLSAAGLASSVDFVGSMTNNVLNCRATSANFDTGHEGHSGWLSIDIANNYLQGWLASYQPQIINVHLGTNDVFQGRTTDAIVASYSRIVQLARASNPRIKIIFDKIIPAAFNNAAIAALNARIPAWAASLNSTDSPIWIADCSSDAGFSQSFLRDGVHTNDQGDEFMARQIGPRLLRAVQDSLA
ncbi:hypothetical protein S7711_11218 [Stachybotrys chartarum IBT 7711]|uniref:SGNH hydrolase-type esterase domain-containing protein n=1 Tax=Stachybotrys chartarum (strain CBS 109288 / IBT 7711) TaxID=1280523 RepID=A0A084AVN6_STACB|nr:hypothetical protein S7711_11218 [Stachybotrys chartarum IBT 7711]